MKLHKQVKVKDQELAAYRDGINDIRRYLSSSKFHNDNMVNVSDVFLRLDEMQSSVNGVECIIVN